MNTSANLSWDFTLINCAYIYTGFTTLYILMLPLFIFVLYTGFKQCRNQRGSSATSHTDIFTFNMAAMEVICIVGTCMICFTIYTGRFDLTVIGQTLNSIMENGQIFFHNFTCLERYLAVVHPVTYLHLKTKTGVIIRNIIVVGVWLISFVVTCFYSFKNYAFNILSVFFAAILSIACITFFSVSVLCVLIRPGPGEGGGQRRKADQSKRRAFITMVAILVALLLKFVVVLVAYIVFLSCETTYYTNCLVSLCIQFLNIPSSLVLPVLYLSRAQNGQNKKHKT